MKRVMMEKRQKERNEIDMKEREKPGRFVGRSDGEGEK